MNIEQFKQIVVNIYDNKQLPNHAKAAALGIVSEQIQLAGENALPWEQLGYTKLSEEALRKCTELGGISDDGINFLKEHNLFR